MATAKKSAPKRTSHKSKVKAGASMRSFRAYPEDLPFFHTSFTRQTAYWLAICALVLALGIWVTHLSVTTQQLYDQVETLSGK
jgi:hypothetical protein